MLTGDHFEKLKCTIMSTQPKGMGGHIAFDADPISVCIAHCLHSVS